MNLPFTGITEYQRDYINQKQKRPDKYIPKNSIIPLEAFPTQYDTINHRDFKEYPIEDCPVNKYKGVNEILKRSHLYMDPIQNKYYY